VQWKQPGMPSSYLSGGQSPIRSGPSSSRDTKGGGDPGAPLRRARCGSIALKEACLQEGGGRSPQAVAELAIRGREKQKNPGGGGALKIKGGNAERAHDNCMREREKETPRHTGEMIPGPTRRAIFKQLPQLGGKKRRRRKRGVKVA